MPKIVIENVPGLDGEYPLNLVFTHRDFRTIKEVANVRANEVMDAINAGDLDIIVALAEIALRRAGRSHSIEDLWDSEAGSISLDVTDVEEDPANPPPLESDRKSVGGNESSGNGTSKSTEPFPATSSPASSGTPLQVSTFDH